ncbi:thrombospondin type 3 repeat-containing protein [uncultured Eudoraea sp.]|uniref:thrombospondin type 3 repeat-containing protein n=1 Tax=uncultured Eudoraea sp. TaxID=1035614 RepID=UPI00260D0EBB|nr:thrombospondin type 3 repeat-containing protein [uncultured Eudoraea sp.]
MRNTIIRLFILLLVISSCSEDDPIKRYNLNTTISPSEGGTVSPSSGTFDSGETFTLTSTPSENYVLKNWSGDVNGVEKTISVTMNSDKNITVNFEKTDSDGDGVTDDIDECPDTPNGETVDTKGCSDSQTDGDSDGVTNDLDTCPNTPSGESVDTDGCSDSQKDTDGDGITNDVDTCSDTLSGETVDTNGCSDSQKDSDNDGVTDDLDTCSDTPSGETVDTNGCSDSQKDTDGDGVSEEVDTCPNTPSGETVDTNGCSDSQKDTDGDGVTDDVDTCPNTPSGETVDFEGCSSSQIPTYLPTDGIVAWYPFNGNSNDGTGNNNNGIINGPVLSTDRKGNNNSSYYFDGVDDYINVTNPTVLNFQANQSFSVSFYYNSDSDMPMDFGGIISRHALINSQPYFGWQITRTKNELAYETMNGCFDFNLDALSHSQWSHYVFVFDRLIGNLKVYKNGSIIVNDDCSGITENMITDYDLKIGADREGKNFSKGKIDDIGIWNRKLTVQEIQNIYNSSNN